MAAAKNCSTQFPLDERILVCEKFVCEKVRPESGEWREVISVANEL